MFEYNRRESLIAKEIVGKYWQFAEIYKHCFSYPRFIGECVILCRILEPESHEDFAKKYFEYAEAHKDLPIEERGLTKDEFYQSAVRYKKLADSKVPNNNIPLETFFHDLTCHVFTETYDGHITNEKPLLAYIRNFVNKNARFPKDIKEDMNTGIDIFVCDENDTPLYGIQIKPSSFFIGFSKGNKADIIEDNRSLVNKYYNAKREYGIETYYCIYDDKRGWVCNERGKLTFKLTDIYDVNSFSVNNYSNLTILTDGVYKNGTKKPKFFNRATFCKQLPLLSVKIEI